MYKLLRTVCRTSNHEMNSKKTRNDTQAVAGMNSRIQISGILGFGATQRRSQGNQEGGQARETRKKTHTPKEEVGRYRSSSVTPVSQPNREAR